MIIKELSCDDDDHETMTVNLKGLSETFKARLPWKMTHFGPNLNFSFFWHWNTQNTCNRYFWCPSPPLMNEPTNDWKVNTICVSAKQGRFSRKEHTGVEILWNMSDVRIKYVWNSTEKSFPNLHCTDCFPSSLKRKSFQNCSFFRNKFFTLEKYIWVTLSRCVIYIPVKEMSLKAWCDWCILGAQFPWHRLSHSMHGITLVQPSMCFSMSASWCIHTHCSATQI